MNGIKPGPLPSQKQELGTCCSCITSGVMLGIVAIAVLLSFLL